jgi:hypothetical protein
VPTRLPSFTPPPPLTIPTYVADTSQIFAKRVPMGLVIFSIAAVGIIIGLFSLSQSH